MNVMPKTLMLASITASMSLVATQASAYNLSATITADNHYALYLGAAGGTNLRFIGRNELGAGGSPGTYNWSEAESWNATYGAGDYIYLVGWSDNSVAQGWIGEFQLFRRPVAPVPLPAPLLLLGSAVMGLPFVRRRLGA